MNPLSKAINMILRGNDNKFKTILNEVLVDRATSILEVFYKQKSKEILKEIQEMVIINPSISLKVSESCKIPSSFITKDGVAITLTDEQIDKISKLYENLNNNNKERLIKLLTESEEAVNRIINLSKTERKSNVK